MQKGDIVKMSEKNPNHLGYGQCAYAGMEGTVSEVWNDGFCIETKSSSLIVPLSKRKGIWIYLNGEHVYFSNKKKKENEKKRSFKEKLTYFLFGVYQD